MGNEELLIKLDQNNFVYVDPNSIVVDGNIFPRAVKQEELVMYVNLEAELVPRSTVISNQASPQVISVAERTFNMLKGNTSLSPSPDFDTAYTDIFSSSMDNSATSQNLGISSLEVTTKGFNAIPTVTINFIDVRGAALFNSPETSPYNVFFHLPWPIFYLTIKGYYGKAIKYRLHLIKFNTRYNSASGNFEIETNFVGSTFAHLNDIPLQPVLNAAYMYPLIKRINDRTDNNSTSTKLISTTRGMNILKSVYDEYKRKGLIANDFPVKTLRELVYLSKSISAIIEKEIFKDVDVNAMTSFYEVGSLIDRLRNSVVFWFKKNKDTKISDNNIVKINNDDFNLIKSNGDSIIFNENNDGSLAYLLKSFYKNLDNIEKQVREAKLNNSNFTNLFVFRAIDNTLKKYTKNINTLYYVSEALLLDDIDKIFTEYETKKKKFELDLEIKLNQVFKKKDGKNTIGFIPTVRNIFAIILANAEVYVRLMKQVHNKAMSVGEKRKTLIFNVHDETNPKNNAIYPWPEIKKRIDGKSVITYPGDKDLANTIQSTDFTLWPEVEFIENYINVATKKYDYTNNDGGASQFTFDNQELITNKKILFLDVFHIKEVYINNDLINFLYEIYERSFNLVFDSTYNQKILNSLHKLEIQNIQDFFVDNPQFNETFQNITNPIDLYQILEGIGFYTKFPFVRQYGYSTSYLSDNKTFSLSKNNDNKSSDDNAEYSFLNEHYRDINLSSKTTLQYPFTSSNFTTLSKVSYQNDLLFQNIFSIDINKSFVVSNLRTNDFYRSENLFANSLSINGQKINILNTPFFHKQLVNNFNKNNLIGKYAGSAYILLNSLNIKDIHENVRGHSISALLREIPALHEIPYYVILKWGSQYHRYKQKILNNVDILGGLYDTNGLTYDTSSFFKKNISDEFVIGSQNINETTDFGINPFFDAIYCQICNGFIHYNVDNPTTLNTNVANGKILTYFREVGTKRLHTSFLDLSKYEFGDEIFLLPSANNIYLSTLPNNNILSQNTKKIIHDDTYEPINYIGKKLYDYNEYFKNIQNEFSLDGNRVKVNDLIATFTPDVLEAFEEVFIYFATEHIAGFDNKYNEVEFSVFTKLLRALSTIPRTSIDNISNLQKLKIDEISKRIMFQQNNLFYNNANPKGIKSTVIKKFYDKGYKSNLPFSLLNKKYLDLYVGEDVNYVSFFNINQIPLNETNVLELRPLIYLWVNNQNVNDFIKNNYLDKVEINNLNSDLYLYLNTLIRSIKTLEKKDDATSLLTNGFNDTPIKLELYNTFKSFNDKWASGNSIGNETLFEQFLFLDKTNRDIGDKIFINLEKLMNLDSITTQKSSLYNILGSLLSGSGMDMRALPAYVNFYNDQKQANSKSNNLVNNVFGTFMEVDTQFSSPKVIVQFVGGTSKILANNNKSYPYNDDSFDASKPNSPLIITTPQVFTNDLLKNNKVVAFEVSVGDEHQNVFKNISLDQASIRNTTESFIALENLARSESGSSTYQVDIGLYDIYKQAAYTCKVEAMGNMMIQPTMYFYLKNVPLFKGTYWITDVTHSISNNNINTNFTGVRMPQSSLLATTESFMATYRPLFDSLINKNKIKKTASDVTTTETTIQINNNSSSIIDLQNNIDSPSLINESGITDYGLRFNGFEGERIIQKINYNNTTYYRTTINIFDNISLYTDTSLLNVYLLKQNKTEIKFGDIRRQNTDFYAIKLDFKNKNTDVLFNKKLVITKPTSNVEIVVGNSLSPFSGITNALPFDFNRGLVLSKSLAIKLNLRDGDVVYFKMID